MHSIKNIYEKIYDFENLHKAWEKARRGKERIRQPTSYSIGYGRRKGSRSGTITSKWIYPSIFIG